MGNIWAHHVPEDDPKGQGKKRKLEDVEQSDADQLFEEKMHTPKRKKVKTTSRYIYETLFLQGENSDITIMALGKEWRLHKVYLCQSGYFSSMFSGSWKESKLDFIHMNIPDENIDCEALQIAFGSLYQDDVCITPAQTVNVLAAATLLGLDGLIQQCADIMKETISSKTVCGYHTSAMTYGQQQVVDKCIDWLSKNLMTSQTAELLVEISPRLMEEVVTSPDLFVIQVEMDIYSMLKKWVFLHLNKGWMGSSRDLSTETDTFFKSLKLTHGPFLDGEMGAEFRETFRCLRLHHIVNDLASTKLLEEDNIIPHSWLMPVYQTQWHQMLRVEQGQDKGPEDPEECDFSRLSMRVGRILQKDNEYCWRWTGFNFGVDLLVSYSNRLIIFKRNAGLTQTCAGSISLQPKRSLMFRLQIASFDSFGQTKFFKSSSIMKLSLEKDEEAVIMAVDRNIKFPLHISANFMFYTPFAPKTPQASTSSSTQSQPDSLAPNQPEASPNESESEDEEQR